MSEQLLDLLRLGLLALLYLFFIRVVWAVWTELRTPALAAAPPAEPVTERSRRKPKGPRRPAALRVVEPAAQAGREYGLAGEMTLGRAPGCTVVIGDTYISQIHARVFLDGEAVIVEDLGSTNGTYRNGAQLTGPQQLRIGDRIQVGGTVLELV